MLAPICLFTYNRPAETRQTVESLKLNYLAKESRLIVFSDGSKNETALPKVVEVRKYLHTITGFKTIEIIESPINKGLANSIITGVTKVIEKYGKVIVLEDDLVSSPNFLNFMNQALDFYTENSKIFSISGYSMQLPSLKAYNEDYYLGYRASSWGWGTWKNRWESVDWQVKDYSSFIWNPVKHYKFMRAGSDLPYMLWKQMNGKIDSWAIRWCYYQFKKDQLTVFPSKSMIESVGIGVAATHTKKTTRFNVSIEKSDQIHFHFKKETLINVKLKNEFKKKFSVINRLKDRL